MAEGAVCDQLCAWGADEASTLSEGHGSAGVAGVIGIVAGETVGDELRASYTSIGQEIGIKGTGRTGDSGSCIIISSTGGAAVDQSSARLALSSTCLPIISN